MTAAPAFQVELLKALIDVAWADHRVVRTEAEMIRDLARKLGVPDAVRAQVDTWLQQRDSLPGVDYGLLKQHKAAVLAALRTLVLADNRIAPEEAAMLREIEAKLS